MKERLPTLKSASRKKKVGCVWEMVHRNRELLEALEPETAGGTQGGDARYMSVDHTDLSSYSPRREDQTP